MVDGIGSGGAGAGINDALKKIQARARELGVDKKTVDGLGTAAAESRSSQANSFGETLAAGLDAVEADVDRTNQLHLDVLQGRLDIHEVTAQIKESEISFQFALQVRNKLLDAYREVMRMSV